MDAITAATSGKNTAIEDQRHCPEDRNLLVLTLYAAISGHLLL